MIDQWKKLFCIKQSFTLEKVFGRLMDAYDLRGTCGIINAFIGYIKT
jgi:hypothetical protein